MTLKEEIILKTQEMAVPRHRHFSAPVWWTLGLLQQVWVLLASTDQYLEGYPE